METFLPWDTQLISGGPNGKNPNPQSGNEDGRVHTSTSPHTLFELCFKVCEMTSAPLPLVTAKIGELLGILVHVTEL